MDKQDLSREMAIMERDLRIAFYQTFMEGEHGRQVLERINQFCGHTDLSYVRGDPGHTAFREGMRNVSIYINNMLDPALLDLSKRQAEATEGE